MVKKAKLKKIKSRRKNYFPTLLAIIILWGTLAGIIYFFDPFILGIIPIAILIFFLAVLFTIATVTISTRRGVIIALAATIFIVLRYFGVGNILNFLLIAGIAITLNLYLSK